MADQSNIQSAASKSIRPFRSSEEYLYAMKEDLAEWLNTLYELDVTTETFMDGLETGTALCRHANNVNRAAQDFLLEYPEAARAMKLPSKDVLFQSRNVSPGSFVARDNVSNFISWCRQELWIKDVLMFETNDLVERCNEKNFVLCLLEVARRGSKFGMLAPMLIQLEEEIEEEIRDQGSLQMDAEQAEEPQKRSPPSRCFGRQESRASVEEEPPEPFVWPQKRVLCDMRNLDELVREILGRCSCPAQFPMIKVSEGKYKVGDSSALIFIRVLRTHVMVRVGGGWDTLEHYLDKHDPCRCAAFAHRYHQAKASGQGGHSKSSSAHSSRSTSPGPHWSRNDGMAPYKPPDRRSVEPSSGPSNPSSTSRLARSQYPSVPTDLDSSAARALLPRPPRDRSEPRHFNPLRNRETMLPVTRRLSGDSDSSTASSKGGGGGAGRRSLGAASHRSSDEIVLLVNRKEGRHMIERPAAGQGPSLSRARSQSRERTSHSTGLKPTPPQASSNGSQAPRTERGRSLVSDGARKFHAPRSHSQGKLRSRTWSRDSSPASTSSSRDARPPPAERKEDRGSPKQGLSSSTKTGQGVLAKRQSSSCSNSPIKGLRNNSPNKKVINTPRPPAPRSPSVAKGRLLPPVTSGGRRSPHSSPRNPQHHAVRGTRSLAASRSNGHTHHRSTPGPEPQEPGGEGSGVYHMLPAIDPQREQDLYRSFEAEFLANTQQARQTSSRECVGKTPAGAGTHVAPAASDANVTDSAYSSSNSSTSSKKGALPDLRESRRNHFLPLEDPLNLLYNFAEPQHFSQVEGEHWRKLPAIHSSREERDCHGNSEASATSDGCCRNMNGDHPSGGGWGSEPLQLRQPNLPYNWEHSDASDDLPPPEACPSPIPLPPSEDCSFQDSSSENSSMCLSLSESHSESPPLTSPLANGMAQAKGQTRPDRVTPTSKHRVTPGIRPRTDKRAEIRPSRIPTPVSYRELQTPGRLSPCHTPPLSPQSSRAAARSAMGRNMHQAFADMVHPQSPSAAMDN